jgi:hypothetical protein
MSTTNYSWQVPVNAGSVDTWGLIINATLEDVDSVVFTNAGLAAQKSANLSDLASASTARTNLGLGTSAVVNTGTSGATIPLCNGANTWAASQVFSAAATFSSTVAVGGLVTRTGQGGHLFHNNSARPSGAITVSTSTPSGGSNGDIWLRIPV